MRVRKAVSLGINRDDIITGGQGGGGIVSGFMPRMLGDFSWTEAQIKEKFGRLTVHLAGSTPAMHAAIHDAEEESIVTCEVCGDAGVLEERHGWWSPRCKAHETWTPWDKLE